MKVVVELDTTNDEGEPIKVTIGVLRLLRLLGVDKNEQDIEIAVKKALSQS